MDKGSENLQIADNSLFPTVIISAAGMCCRPVCAQMTARAYLLSSSVLNTRITRPFCRLLGDSDSLRDDKQSSLSISPHRMTVTDLKRSLPMTHNHTPTSLRFNRPTMNNRKTSLSIKAHLLFLNMIINPSCGTICFFQLEAFPHIFTYSC